MTLIRVLEIPQKTFIIISVILMSVYCDNYTTTEINQLTNGRTTIDPSYTQKLTTKLLETTIANNSNETTPQTITTTKLVIQNLTKQTDTSTAPSTLASTKSNQNVTNLDNINIMNSNFSTTESPQSNGNETDDIDYDEEYEDETIMNMAICTDRKRLDDMFQPVYSDFAKVKKCCPDGENYQQNKTGNYCAKSNVTFDVKQVNAVFYELCVEDTDDPINLEIEYGNPCPNVVSYVYSENEGDILYVIQNGSLLEIDSDTMNVLSVYCLDMQDSGYLQAIVCDNQTHRALFHVSKAQSYLYAICKLIELNFILSIHN